MKQEKQQTAVEWLINEIIFKSEYESLGNNYFIMSDKDIDNIIKQAKEMEKQQISKALTDGSLIHVSSQSLIVKVDPEKYYNETYGK